PVMVDLVQQHDVGVVDLHHLGDGAGLRVLPRGQRAHQVPGGGTVQGGVVGGHAHVELMSEGASGGLRGRGGLGDRPHRGEGEAGRAGGGGREGMAAADPWRHDPHCAHVPPVRESGGPPGGRLGAMRIAFLGTGRMGTELALHLLAQHRLVVWNRTSERTRRLAEAGAEVAASAAEAVAGADLVVTSLFGPDAVRELVLGQDLVPAGVPWVDTTTVSPADADDFAAAVPGYVAVPVVGSLGPARAGRLGVYVGTADDALREQVTALVAPWADPDRLRPVGSAREAAVGKLLANLALAVSAQGLREALALGEATGTAPEEVLGLLEGTGLAFRSEERRVGN